MESWEEVLEGFLRHLAAKGYCQGIVEDYGEDAGEFLERMEGRGVTDLRAVGKAELEGYVEWLERCTSPKTGRPLSGLTKASRIRAVRRFFRWLEWSGRILADPSGCLKAPVVRGRKPRVLSAGEVERLLASPEAGTLGGIRVRAVLEVLAGAGLTVDEMAGLGLTDVSVEEGWVRVEGRVVPLPERAAVAVGAYLREVRPRWVLGKEDPGVLWVSPGGEASSLDVFRLMVRRYARKAGVPDVFTRRLRNSYAARLVRDGAGAEEIGKRLGIKAESVRIYKGTEAGR